MGRRDGEFRSADHSRLNQVECHKEYFQNEQSQKSGLFVRKLKHSKGPQHWWTANKTVMPHFHWWWGTSAGDID